MNQQIANQKHFDSLDKFDQNEVLEALAMYNDCDMVLEDFIEQELCQDEDGWLICLDFSICMGASEYFVLCLQGEQMAWIYYNIK